MDRKRFKQIVWVMILWFLASVIAYNLVQPLPVVVTTNGEFVQNLTVEYSKFFVTKPLPEDYIVNSNTPCAKAVEIYWDKLNILIMYQFAILFLLMLLLYKGGEKDELESKN